MTAPLGTLNHVAPDKANEATEQTLNVNNSIHQNSFSEASFQAALLIEQGCSCTYYERAMSSASAASSNHGLQRSRSAAHTHTTQPCPSRMLRIISTLIPLTTLHLFEISSTVWVPHPTSHPPTRPLKHLPIPHLNRQENHADRRQPNAARSEPENPARLVA